MFCYFYESPIGVLRILQKGDAIVSILRTKDLPKNIAVKDLTIQETDLIRETCRQLQEYFDGKRKEFDLPVSPEGTEFQKKAWDALQQIPYGQTISYGEEAKRIGCKCARAVGGANGKNPVIIVIPCHRVIRGDGGMGGYTGGLDIKEYLLELEQKYR